MCALRQASQSNRGEEVDGEASVSGIITRKKTFEERLQSPETHKQTVVLLFCIQQHTLKSTENQCCFFILNMNLML